MEAVFRLIFLVLIMSAFLISGTYRRRARSKGDVINREDEGKLAFLIRMVFALPLFIALLLYIINPDALAWSRLELSLWIRWSAVVSGLMTVPFLLWVFSSIGRNISETVLTKRDHELITTGPYSWIRHPLYLGSLWLLFSLSLIASNWFLFSYSAIAFVAFRWIVIPAEEKQLIKTFGDAYLEYRNRTGAMFPRLF